MTSAFLQFVGGVSLVPAVAALSELLKAPGSPVAVTLRVFPLLPRDVLPAKLSRYRCVGGVRLLVVSYAAID